VYDSLVFSVPHALSSQLFTLVRFCILLHELITMSNCLISIPNQ